LQLRLFSMTGALALTTHPLAPNDGMGYEGGRRASSDNSL
jgi:hypothetical protein